MAPRDILPNGEKRSGEPMAWGVPQSLQVRLTLVVGLLILATGWGLAFLLEHDATRNLRNLLEAQQYSTARAVAQSIDGQLRLRLDSLARVAGRIPDGVLSDPRQMNAFLAERRAIYNLFDLGLAVVRADDGGEIATWPPGTRTTPPDYKGLDVFNAAAAGRPVIGSPVRVPGNGIPVIPFAVPISGSDGRTAAVMIGLARIEAADFLTAARSGESGGTGDILVAAPLAGVFVTGTDPAYILKPLPPPGVNHLHDRAMGGFMGAGVTVSSQGVEELVAFHPVPATGWFVVARLPTDQAFAAIRVMRWMVFGGAAGVSMLVALIAAIFVRRALRPLKIAARALDEMSLGTTPLRSLPTARNDEVGRMVASFNRLVGWLQRETEALRVNEEKLRTLYELAPIGILLTDMDGHFVEFNAEFLRICGYPDDELKKLDTWALTPSQYAPDEQRQLDSLRKAGRYGPYEKHTRRKDGTLVPLRLNGVLVTGPDGRPAIWSIVEDISEWVEQRDRQQKLLDELNCSNHELEQFAYIASHDLREPLRMIGSYIALLERRYADQLDSDAREFIAYARDGAVRMNRMVLELLEFSRIGRLTGTAMPVALGDIVAETITDLSETIKECGAEISVAPDLPTVSGWPSELVRLFQNLIGNALKYRHADRPPVISIFATADAEGWTISIADNGIGIEAEYFEKIFNIFQRLHTRDRFEGTGIGLAICRKIVQHHGGRIGLNSIPGTGSTFFFTLPRAPT